jgi:hypothetical protein
MQKKAERNGRAFSKERTEPAVLNKLRIIKKYGKKCGNTGKEMEEVANVAETG